MSKKGKKLIIILTITIVIITITTIIILINKKNNNSNIEVAYNQTKEEVIDIIGNVMTVPSKNNSFTIKGKKMKFCFKKENECLNTTYVEKGNTVILGNLKDESLSGTFKKTITDSGIILEKELSSGTIIKYYYDKKQG